mgnify:CR=1 FL=1
MRVIADNGRFVLAEDGPRLLFLGRRGLIPVVLVFVTGLLTVILGVNAALLIGLGMGQDDGRVPVGAGLLVAATLLGWACVALVRRRRARREQPLDPATAIVVLDREAGVLRDSVGQVLAPLAQVKLMRRMQLASSARALHVVWPHGDRVVYRGDPFAGAIDEPIDQIRQRGITVG